VRDTQRLSVEAWLKELAPNFQEPTVQKTKADLLTNRERCHLAEHAPAYLGVLAVTPASDVKTETP